MERHKENLGNALDMLKGLGELLIIGWYERHGRLKEWVAKVCEQGDDAITKAWEGEDE